MLFCIAAEPLGQIKGALPETVSKVANVTAVVFVQGFRHMVIRATFGVEAVNVLYSPRQVGPVGVVGSGAVMQPLGIVF